MELVTILSHYYDYYYYHHDHYLLSANGFVYGGSGTTITQKTINDTHHTKQTHNTQYTTHKITNTIKHIHYTYQKHTMSI